MTNSELQSLKQEWQGKLGLNDWTITVCLIPALSLEEKINAKVVSLKYKPVFEIKIDENLSDNQIELQIVWGLICILFKTHNIDSNSQEKRDLIKMLSTSLLDLKNSNSRKINLNTSSKVETSGDKILLSVEGDSDE